MKRISLLTAGLLGVFMALTVVALTYLGERLFQLPFVPFDIFDWMARVMPGVVITLVIDTMVNAIRGLNLGPTASTAKMIEQTIAIVQFVVGGGIFGVILGALGRRWPARLVVLGILGGVILLVPVLLIEATLGFSIAGLVKVSPFVSIVWLALIFAGWGAILGRLLLETAPSATRESAGVPASALSRRQFLYLVGAGAFTVMVSALGVSVLSGEKRPRQRVSGTEPAGGSSTSGPAASPPQSELEARFEPVPGTRAEITSNDNFYRIDIDTLPPEVDASTWRLELVGLVEKPLSLSLDDIRARKAVSQFITLECISNTIGGDLISTALWTGVPLKDILAEAGLKPGAQAIAMQAVDGFYESLSIEEAMDERTLLVYEMNGQPLPVAHGFPLRIYIPNHYGMKQPKWLTRMEVIDHAGSGYWVDRGWSATAIPKTTSVIDTVDLSNMDPNTRLIPLGGIAYAGASGISKVEIQVDGRPWQEAELRDPPLSPLTWVQWRYLWKAEDGRHTLAVRAYDGTGALQEAQPSPPYPDGATGNDMVDVNVRS